MEELADRLEITAARVRSLEELRQTAVSLDAPVGGDDERLATK